MKLLASRSRKLQLAALLACVACGGKVADGLGQPTSNSGAAPPDASGKAHSVSDAGGLDARIDSDTDVDAITTDASPLVNQDGFETHLPGCPGNNPEATPFTTDVSTFQVWGEAQLTVETSPPRTLRTVRTDGSSERLHVLGWPLSHTPSFTHMWAAGPNRRVLVFNDGATVWDGDRQIAQATLPLDVYSFTNVYVRAAGSLTGDIVYANVTKRSTFKWAPPEQLTPVGVSDEDSTVATSSAAWFEDTLATTHHIQGAQTPLYSGSVEVAVVDKDGARTGTYTMPGEGWLLTTADYVYFSSATTSTTNPYQLMRVPRSGGPAMIHVASLPNRLRLIAHADHYVYGLADGDNAKDALTRVNVVTGAVDRITDVCNSGTSFGYYGISIASYDGGILVLKNDVLYNLRSK